MFRPRVSPLVALLGIIVFALTWFSPTAQAQFAEHILYPFGGPPNCGYLAIAPLIPDTAGNLYGTTASGGSDSTLAGCVFKLSHSSSGWTETLLHSFNLTDGYQPSAALVFDKLGNLYGTAFGGGTYGGGVAFELGSSSGGVWTETILHNFGASIPNEGHGAGSNLIFDSTGNLYGTTAYSFGQQHGGTVYKLSPGSSGWTETVLYAFPGVPDGPDGDAPAGGVVMDREGNLYGATQAGGAYGYGAVYELARLSDGTYQESVIHSFDLTDGSGPLSGLTLDRHDILYGTTDAGGDVTACPYGCGLVFRLKKDAAGNWTEDVLHQLTGGDGISPKGPVVFDGLGNLYAAASSGGLYVMGSVFELTPTASGPWNEALLHSFDYISQSGTDGAAPYAGVILRNGKVFGTTDLGGGPHNAGTIFEIALPASASP
jgi:uncharacterized repeat protein (TIGR03803 family)